MRFEKFVEVIFVLEAAAGRDFAVAWRRFGTEQLFGAGKAEIDDELVQGGVGVAPEVGGEFIAADIECGGDRSAGEGLGKMIDDIADDVLDIAVGLSHMVAFVFGAEGAETMEEDGEEELLLGQRSAADGIGEAEEVGGIILL